MTSHDTRQARLTTVASFPTKYFLENLAVRHDNSILVTVATQKELWYVAPTHQDLPVTPVHLHTFDEITTGIAEVEPDVFCVCTSDVYETHKSYLHRIDLRQWTPKLSIEPEVILQFAEPVGGLNGCCLVAPGVLLIADMFANLIWRVDLAPDGGKADARVWLKHDSMAHSPLPVMKPMQPGINGVRYASRTHFLYYTSTAKQLFMRVRVDPVTYEPADEPEFVAGGRMADDFCIDEDAGVAYLATHRQNTIDRVSLEPSGNRDFARHSIAGDPHTEELIGPSSGAWGRGSGEYGRVAYFLTDGGTTSPLPDGKIRPAKVLRIEV